MLTLAALICVEPPHRRKDERFTVAEPASVRMTPMLHDAVAATSGGPEIACTIRDISLGGAAVHAPGGWRELMGRAELVLRAGAGEPDLALPFTVVHRRGDMLTLQFHSEAWIRRALIRKLFTGEYHKEVEAIRPMRIARTLSQAVFSPGKPGFRKGATPVAASAEVVSPLYPASSADPA